MNNRFFFYLFVHFGRSLELCNKGEPFVIYEKDGYSDLNYLK